MIEQEQIRLTLDLEGIVQGVGFRPATKRLADEMGLGGWIQNRSGSVRLALEGPANQVDRFFTELAPRLPSLARLDAVRPLRREPVTFRNGFRILESREGDVPANVIPTDLASCGACISEVMDPADRRYGYPFTTCTRCGPRYTVVRAMPYDRGHTTLSVFPLCPSCRGEYKDPDDRRFHAENTACPRCGPSLVLTDTQGTRVPGNPLATTRAALAEGRIVGVRGIGGFQLAVDAPELVRSLVIVNSAPELILHTFKDRARFFQRLMIVRLLGMRKMGEVLSARLLPKPEHQDLRREFVERWTQNDKRAYLDSIRALVGWSVSEHLSEIRIPTLAVAADDDYSPVSVKEAYVSRMPRAELVVIPDSRHATPVEQPQAFNEAVAAFLARQG